MPERFRALLTRSTARDIYDASMISQKLEMIDRPLFREISLFYLAMQKDDPCCISTQTIQNVTDSQVRDMLMPMLSRSEKVDVNAMKGKAIGLADELLRMTNKELAFFDTLYRERRVDPSLLFHGFEVSEGLEDHPFIAWQLNQLDNR